MISLKIYANLLGRWTELTENDTINDFSPEKFISKHLNYNNDDTLSIKKNNVIYVIHKSCIQYTYTQQIYSI